MELREALRTLGMEPSRGLVLGMFRDVDEDGSRTIRDADFPEIFTKAGDAPFQAAARMMRARLPLLGLPCMARRGSARRDLVLLQPPADVYRDIVAAIIWPPRLVVSGAPQARRI